MSSGRCESNWQFGGTISLIALGTGFISDHRKAQWFTIEIDGNCFFGMHFQPGCLPIGDVFAIGWKLLQLSRRGEQRCWRDLTNDKHIEQTVVDACARSDLETAASLPSISDDCHRAAAGNFATRQDELPLIMMKVDGQNSTDHSVSGRTKQAFEFG